MADILKNQIKEFLDKYTPLINDTKIELTTYPKIIKELTLAKRPDIQIKQKEKSFSFLEKIVCYESESFARAIDIWNKAKEMNFVTNIKRNELYDAIDKKYGNRITKNKTQIYEGIKLIEK